MKKHLLGLICFLICIPAMVEASAYNGSIGAIAENGYYVYITVETPSRRSGNVPACATHDSYYYALDVSTNEGKNIHAAVLLAYISGTNVSIFGTESCAGNKEVLGSIVLN